MHKLAAVLTTALSATCLITAAGVAHADPRPPTTFYIDASAGDDSAAGTDTAPWKSLAKVNGFDFVPGDQIMFKRGGSWTGTLELSESGDSDHRSRSGPTAPAPCRRSAARCSHV